MKEIDKNAILPDDLNESLRRGTIISVSISSLDKSVTEMLEPAASSPLQRLELMKQLKTEGFLTGINCLQLLPFISDSEEKIEAMISTCKTYCANYVLASGLTLFRNQPADSKTLYYNFLGRKYPHLIPGYKKLYRIFPFPSKEYIQNIEHIVKSMCEKHNIKNSII